MIINLTGQAGAGKTTLAKELCAIIPNSINIDGDELRTLFDNKDYSREGRYKNIRRAYDIAVFLESKGYVPVISLISPYLELREELKSRGGVIEVYVVYTGVRGREEFHVKDYEVPQDDFATIDTTNQDAKILAEALVIGLKEKANKSKHSES